MSIISGGEFGSWGKTPFTCNLLRLNAFYMQIYPGQLARMRRHRTPSSFLWFLMSLLFSVCPMIDAILGMLRVLRNFRENRKKKSASDDKFIRIHGEAQKRKT